MQVLKIVLVTFLAGMGAGLGTGFAGMSAAAVITPVLVTFLYLVLGCCFGLWHPGWLIFFTIPLYYLPASQRSPLRLLSNPVMVTIIYLLLGFECGLWHPGWLIFLAIPILNAATK